MTRQCLESALTVLALTHCLRPKGHLVERSALLADRPHIGVTVGEHDHRPSAHSQTGLGPEEVKLARNLAVDNPVVTD